MRCRLSVRPAAATGSGDGVALTGSSVTSAVALVEDVESTGHAAAAFHTSTASIRNGVRGANSLVGLLADTGTTTIEVGPRSGITTIRPTFESNITIGIHVRAGRATIRNAVASDNGDTGISLQSNPGDSFHVVQFTNAERNGLTPGSVPDGVGILVGPSASASVNSTTMLGNSAAGMIFERGTSNLLQLGCDIFAHPAAPTRNNGRAGLCLQNSGASGSQVVQANVFSTPPSCPAMRRELPAEALCSALPRATTIGSTSAAPVAGRIRCWCPTATTAAEPRSGVPVDLPPPGGRGSKFARKEGKPLGGESR
jgi:hypothetical protein